MQEIQVQSLGQEDPLEKEMATHSSILAWEISWTEEVGGLQSTESQSRIRLSTQHSTVSISLPRTREDTGDRGPAASAESGHRAKQPL